MVLFPTSPFPRSISLHHQQPVPTAWNEGFRLFHVGTTLLKASICGDMRWSSISTIKSNWCTCLAESQKILANRHISFVCEQVKLSWPHGLQSTTKQSNLGTSFYLWRGKFIHKFSEWQEIFSIIRNSNFSESPKLIIFTLTRPAAPYWRDWQRGVCERSGEELTAIPRRMDALVTDGLLFRELKRRLNGAAAQFKLLGKLHHIVFVKLAVSESIATIVLCYSGGSHPQERIIK